MSGGFRYAPGPNAILQSPYNITLLSQRDVGLQVPINYETHPSVSVTAACFNDNRFEAYSLTRCMSNLLSSGFRRLHLDLYWDSSRRAWSFCPVAMPDASDFSRKETLMVALGQASTTTLIPSANAQGPSESSSTVDTTSISTAPQVEARQMDVAGINTAGTELETPGTSPTTTVSKATLTVGLTTSGDEAIAALPTRTASSNADELLYSIGPYTCSTISAIDVLTGLLPSFLEATDDTLQAVMQYVIINLHAAASIAAPEAPAPAPGPSDLPRSDELLGHYFFRNASSFLYTPRMLNNDRHNLNGSWFDPDYNMTAPLRTYYEDLNLDTGEGRSEDGWPSSSYTEFRRQNHFRLLFGFGRVDPQMEDYSFEQDIEYIFPQGYMSAYRTVTQTSEGSLTDGCIYDPGNSTLMAANNSWAVATVSGDAITIEEAARPLDQSSPSLASITNLTSCGLSPLLNTTLDGVSADIDITPYRAFALSAIWSWAPGEPRSANNITSEVGTTDSSSRSRLRCSIMDPSIPGGRWRATNCSDSYHAACRITNEPLMWTISPTPANYTLIESTCPDNATFSVPRTALENRYLLEAYRRSHINTTTSFSDTTPHDPPTLPPLYLNLNSLDVPSCWVTGVTTTCPYDIATDDSSQILIPTIAGVVVLVLAVLLVIIKCGANRAHSRRRRKRGGDGWDYEGVPS